MRVRHANFRIGLRRELRRHQERDDPGEVESWGHDLGLDFEVDAIERGLAELERRTRKAADAMVTGVPTFMLADWPMGGIQDDDTMVTLICRFARRARERGTA